MIRPLKFLFLVILGAAGVTAGLAVFAAACAHADAAGPPVLVADPTTTVVAWVGAILGGLSMLLTVAFQVLKVVAPLTKTPIDDEIRDGIGEILDHLRVQSTTTVVPARNPEIGRAALPVTVVLAALLLGAVATQPACGARQRAAAATEAFIDCQDDDLATAVGELVPLAEQALMVAIGGTGHIDTAQLKAIAAPLRSNLARCALAAAIAGLATPKPATTGAPAAAGLTVDGPALKGAFTAVRGELGWPAARLAGGEVL